MFLEEYTEPMLFGGSAVSTQRKNLTIPSTETSWLIADLFPMTNYSLKVAAVNSLGMSELSSSFAFTTDEEGI